MGKHYTVKQFEAAIPGSGGIIATIARRVGCSWHTAQTYINESAKLGRLFEDEANKIDDMAESVVIKAMQDGDVSVAKWWLERRRRGKYATKQELDLSSGGEPFKVIIEYADSKADNPAPA